MFGSLVCVVEKYIAKNSTGKYVVLDLMPRFRDAGEEVYHSELCKACKAMHEAIDHITSPVTTGLTTPTKRLDIVQQVAQAIVQELDKLSGRVVLPRTALFSCFLLLSYRRVERRFGRSFLCPSKLRGV